MSPAPGARTQIEALVAEIRQEGFEATAIVADVNVEPDVIDLVARTISTYGRIDIAFNNAGTEGEFTPFVDQSNEVYETIFNANVRGVFWSMKHQAKAMLAQAMARSSTTPRWAASSASATRRFTSPASTP